MLIFHDWTDTRGGFSYYSFSSTPVRHLRANINDAHLDGHPNRDYRALRYTGIVEDATTAPPVPERAGGGASRPTVGWRPSRQARTASTTRGRRR
ncbi:hypothetical protein K7G98_04990 [Saccharothrix sp. MB29]|nr:hypothetical protein [Saccharothrix sp. MB29]